MYRFLVANRQSPQVSPKVMCPSPKGAHNKAHNKNAKPPSSYNLIMSHLHISALTNLLPCLLHIYWTGVQYTVLPGTYTNKTAKPPSSYNLIMSHLHISALIIILLRILYTGLTCTLYHILKYYGTSCQRKLEEGQEWVCRPMDDALTNSTTLPSMNFKWKW